MANIIGNNQKWMWVVPVSANHYDFQTSASSNTRAHLCEIIILMLLGLTRLKLWWRRLFLVRKELGKELRTIMSWNKHSSNNLKKTFVWRRTIIITCIEWLSQLYLKSYLIISHNINLNVQGFHKEMKYCLHLWISWMARLV